MKSGKQFARRFDNAETVVCHWENGVITRVELAPDADPGNIWLVPGLLDLQVNGYGGVDFQQDDLDKAALLKAVRAFRADGGHRFLLTLITDEWSALTARLKHLRQVVSKSAELQATIAGWHIEGPFLSSEPGFHGAHDPALMIDPTFEHFTELRSLLGDDPLLITIAPERTEDIVMMVRAKLLRIKFSLGHTNAPQHLIRLATCYAAGFTHLGNGCPRELDRHDNIIWRVLNTPNLTFSLIPDKMHVSSMLFNVLHRAADPDSIYYTTDAMAAAGAPPGNYTLGKVKVEVGEDQIVRQPGKTNFAGSALTPLECIKRAREMLNCEWRPVWRRYSVIPAQLMGFPNPFDVNHPANLSILKFDRGNMSIDSPAVS